MKTCQDEDGPYTNNWKKNKLWTQKQPSGQKNTVQMTGTDCHTVCAINLGIYSISKSNMSWESETQTEIDFNALKVKMTKWNIN